MKKNDARGAYDRALVFATKMLEVANKGKREAILEEAVQICEQEALLTTSPQRKLCAQQLAEGIRRIK